MPIRFMLTIPTSACFVRTTAIKASFVFPVAFSKKVLANSVSSFKIVAHVISA